MARCRQIGRHPFHPVGGDAHRRNHRAFFGHAPRRGRSHATARPGDQRHAVFQFHCFSSLFASSRLIRRLRRFCYEIFNAKVQSRKELYLISGFFNLRNLCNLRIISPFPSVIRDVA